MMPRVTEKVRERKKDTKNNYINKKNRRNRSNGKGIFCNELKNISMLRYHITKLQNASI